MIASVLGEVSPNKKKPGSIRRSFRPSCLPWTTSFSNYIQFRTQHVRYGSLYFFSSSVEQKSCWASSKMFANKTVGKNIYIYKIVESLKCQKGSKCYGQTWSFGLRIEAIRCVFAAKRRDQTSQPKSGGAFVERLSHD